ncbi:SIS domain-containing protein [Candidatus Nitrososphaera sp. FF02]|uniref:SIS domain-containing protein n=1 Tax=Candidatus Nitrososphaera sp. FF02 TaxID=3398226 RepID=UPI0039E7F9AD
MPKPGSAYSNYKKLHLIYNEWPEHFRKAARIRIKLDHDQNYYRSVIMCGMGGSATYGDILNDIMQYTSKMPSAVVKGQKLPFWVGKNTLALITSVSGNTRETLNMMKEAQQRGAEIVCISSGGKLQDLAMQGGHRHIVIPNLSVPRASLPYLMMPGLRIIDYFKQGLLKPEIESLYRSMNNVAKQVSLSAPLELNPSKQLASFLENSLPVCLTSPSLISAGTRFKNSLNENAKLHCLRESVLEAAHNEIVPFTYDNGFIPRVLLLKWKSDSTIVSECFSRITRLFKKVRQPYLEIEMQEKSMVHAIICAIYLLDYTTIYMAFARKIDPLPTPAIEILKEED